MSEERPLEGLSFEEALSELEQVIRELETGEVNLDAAISRYERGVRLGQHCAALLDRTERRVTELTMGTSGQLEERPFAPGDGAGEAT